MKSRVLVTDKLDESGLTILKQVSDVDYKPGIPAEELREIIKDYDALLVRSQTQATKEILEQANRLKIIGRAGVGVDNIDVETATEKGIIVVNSPEGNTIAAAEHTVALMMALVRHIPKADQSCKQNKWERSKYIGTELNGQTLGIIGLGKIGQRVGKVALALGMRVLGYDPFVSKEKAEDMGFIKVELTDIYKQAHFITLHVPKTKETVNMINKSTIETMQDGVFIINCARGGLINEQDLADAINTGKVAGAAIDVFNEEPCTDSPLHKCGDKVVLTPHLGASTHQAQLNVAIDVSEQIRDVLSGGVAKSAVNLPGLKPDLVKHIKHYLGLAEYMGSMLRQISTGVIKEIEIEALGRLSDKNIEGLKLAILKGALSVNLDGITFVNAPHVAKERGIKVTELKCEESGAYIDKLLIKMKTETETKIIAGTVLQGNIPAIIQIDNYPVNIRPENHSIITFHRDQPGIVAQVSQILWQGQINISSMNLGRTKDSARAVMVISVDGAVDEESLKKIESINGIDVAKYIRLKGKI
jgi:D-3-phosphoglycerate dehydrogenase / 2-oxoglutarate reductase